MAYLTPDTLPTTYICRRLRIPHSLEWMEIVNGALSELIKPRRFEAFGDITPEETAEVFQEMFFEYLKGEPCLIGAILPYATTNPPDGTLPCDGGNYLRADHPNLYAALDLVYIIDADTFKTPDLLGRAIVGTGEGIDLTARVIGDIGGTETHELTVEELAVHTHTTQPHSHTNTPHTHNYDHPIINIDVEGAGVPDPVAIGQPFFPAPTSLASVSIDASTVDVDSTGEGTPHENMMPFHALRYCIVAR